MFQMQDAFSIEAFNHFLLCPLYLNPIIPHSPAQVTSCLVSAYISPSIAGLLGKVANVEYP